MRRFASEEINVVSRQQSAGKTWTTLEELRERNFKTYAEFEEHQFGEHKTIWIDTLIAVSGCRNHATLECQYALFGDAFLKFYGEHIEWVTNPSSCPPVVKRNCEKTLRRIIERSARNRKCHWVRDHTFFCYCDEETES